MFYIYTGSISFSFLKSDSTRSYKLENSAYLARCPGAPDLVSSKFVYRLADKVGLKNRDSNLCLDVNQYDFPELAALALTHYETQLSPKTFMHELFTDFAATHKKAQEILCRYLTKHIEEHRQELIGKMRAMGNDKKLRFYWVMLAVLTIQPPLVTQPQFNSTDIRQSISPPLSPSWY